MKDYWLPAFEENLLDCEVGGAQTSGVFWLSKVEIEAGIGANQFQQQYSFFSTLGEYYSNNALAEGGKATAKMERYGGYGVAGNGGGARSVNIGDMQVKGVGINPLIGRGSVGWYSSGSLGIVDAVQEVIYAALIDKITPIGAVKIRGVIKTASTAAYLPKNAELTDVVPCWGALLVRERCIRPGHFLRSMYFEPMDEYKGVISSDVVRMRRVMKRLKLTLGDSRRVAVLLSDFALKNARQFGFCKAARLSHGAVTPSNLAMDGRWLDLPTCGFMDSGKNYINVLDQLPAFSEYEVVKQILIEIAYNYSKYGNENINVAPILRMYDQAYSFFFHKYCSYILGIPVDLWPDQGKNASCDYVVFVINSLINHDPRPISITKPSELKDDDPLLVLLEFLYRDIFQDHNSASLDRLSLYGIDTLLLKEAFFDLLSECYKKSQPDCTYNSFICSLMICSLRRFYFAVYFYRDRLYTNLKAGLFSHDLVELERLLNSSMEIIDWAFNEVDFISGALLIFNLNLDSWWYDAARDEYSRTFSGEKTMFIDKDDFFSQMFSVFDKYYDDEIVIKYTRKLHTFMSSLAD